MTGLIDPWTGASKAWTWRQHKDPKARSAADRANPNFDISGRVYLGGTDYITRAGDVNHAPFGGIVELDDGGQPMVRHVSGWTYCLLEQDRVLCIHGAEVIAGAEIAVAGHKYTHAHGMTPAGKRVPWRTVYKKVRRYNEEHGIL